MDDLVHVQIMHAASDLLGPRHHPVNSDHVLLSLEQIKQRPVRAKLHHYTKARLLSTDLNQRI